MEYAEWVAALDDRKLREEYNRAKEQLFRSYRYGLWAKGEAALRGEIALLEAELARRRPQAETPEP